MFPTTRVGTAAALTAVAAAAVTEVLTIGAAMGGVGTPVVALIGAVLFTALAAAGLATWAVARGDRNVITALAYVPLLVVAAYAIWIL